MKTSMNYNRDPDSDFTLVTNKNKINSRKLDAVSSNSTSPELKHIINNPPLLSTSNSAFNYNNSLSAHDNTSSVMVINNAITTDNFDESNLNHYIPQDNSTSISISSSTIFTTPNTIKKSLQHTQHTFSSDYNGIISILVECVGLNKNLGSWSPVKAAKVFSTDFTGITNIKPAGSKKIKITFDSVINGNLCLNSDILIK